MKFLHAKFVITRFMYQSFLAILKKHKPAPTSPYCSPTPIKDNLSFHQPNFFIMLFLLHPCYILETTCIPLLLLSLSVSLSLSLSLSLFLSLSLSLSTIRYERVKYLIKKIVSSKFVWSKYSTHQMEFVLKRH